MGLVTSCSGRKATWWRPTWALVTPVNAIRVGVGLKKLSVKSAARHARSPRNKSSSPAWRWRWPTTTSCPLHCWSNCSTRSTTPTWQGRCRSSLRSKWRLLLNDLCKTFKLLLLLRLLLLLLWLLLLWLLLLWLLLWWLRWLLQMDWRSVNVFNVVV